jgi:hypothetical protein
VSGLFAKTSKIILMEHQPYVSNRELKLIKGTIAPKYQGE